MLDANDQLRSPAGLQGPDRRLPRRRAAAAVRRGRASWTGAENRRLSAWANELPAVLVNVQRQPGANVIEVVDRVQELLPQLTASLPSTLQVAVISDRTGTIRASVRDVQHELVFAVALVVLVTFLFLRNIPATIIPSVVVPLSLIGTFGVMYLAGFSINNLTLMALTIATGFVVDDAIVMVENIARHIEEGETPFKAALDRRPGDRLHAGLADHLADRGADPAALHGGRGRTPVPRVRDHAGGVDPDLAGGVADAHADDERAAAAGTCTRRNRAGSTGRAARCSTRLIARLRPAAAVGAPASAADAARGARDAGADRRALHRRAEGLLPGAGHRRHPGDHRGAAVGVVRGDGRAAAGGGARDPGRAGRDGPVVVHRRGRQQRDAEQRPHAHHARAARPAARGRPPRSSRACGARLQERARHHRLPAAGAGPDDRGPRQPHAVPVHHGGSRRATPERVGAEAGRSPARRAGTAGRGERPAGPRAAGVPEHRSRRGQPSRRQRVGDRRRALRRVRPAADLDDLHAGEPVPRRARGGAAIPARPRRARADLRGDRRRRPAARCAATGQAPSGRAASATAAWRPGAARRASPRSRSGTRRSSSATPASSRR